MTNRVDLIRTLELQGLKMAAARLRARLEAEREGTSADFQGAQAHDSFIQSREEGFRMTQDKSKEHLNILVPRGLKQIAKAHGVNMSRVATAAIEGAVDATPAGAQLYHCLGCEKALAKGTAHLSYPYAATEFSDIKGLDDVGSGVLVLVTTCPGCYAREELPRMRSKVKLFRERGKEASEILAPEIERWCRPGMGVGAHEVLAKWVREHYKEPLAGTDFHECDNGVILTYGRTLCPGDTISKIFPGGEGDFS